MTNCSPGQETKKITKIRDSLSRALQIYQMLFTQSYIDGQFLVYLKKRARTGSFKQMFSSAIAKFDSDNSSKCGPSVKANFVRWSEKTKAENDASFDQTLSSTGKMSFKELNLKESMKNYRMKKISSSSGNFNFLFMFQLM